MTGAGSASRRPGGGCSTASGASQTSSAGRATRTGSASSRPSASARPIGDAEREYAPHVEYFFRKGLGSIPMERLALHGGIGLPGLQAILRDPGDFGVYAQMRTATYQELADAGCVICGGPDTVADQL